MWLRLKIVKQAFAVASSWSPSKNWTTARQMSCKCNHRCERRFENPVKVSTHHVADALCATATASEQWWIAHQQQLQSCRITDLTQGLKAGIGKTFVCMPCEENIVEVCGSSSSNAYVWHIYGRVQRFIYHLFTQFFLQSKNICKAALCCCAVCQT